MITKTKNIHLISWSYYYLVSSLFILFTNNDMMDITSTCSAFENDTNASLAFERKQNRFPQLERNVDDENSNTFSSVEQNSSSSTNATNATNANDATLAFERKQNRFPKRERNADDDKKRITNDLADQMSEQPKQEKIPKPAKTPKAAKDISSLTEDVETALSSEDISQILPYNDNLVDKVIEYEAGKVSSKKKQNHFKNETIIKLK